MSALLAIALPPAVLTLAWLFGALPEEPATEDEETER